MALALLSSFAAVEVHLAGHLVAHQPPASAGAGSAPHDHRSHPSQLETAPVSIDRRCLVCLFSSHRRCRLSDLPGVLPRLSAAGVPAAGEYPVLASFSVLRPVSRGPPVLL